MTIIESWEKSKQLAVADTQKPDVTEHWRSMRHAAVTILSCCIAEFQDATTPREPEPEWFDRWPSWQVYVDGPGWLPIYNTRLDHDEFDGAPIVRFGEDWDTGFYTVDEIVQCWPILDTFPAPVGWQVLETKENT